MASAALILAILAVLLTGQAVGEVCSKENVGADGVTYSACSNDCVTAKLQYPKLAPSSITLCKSPNEDGSECLSVISTDICSGDENGRAHLYELAMSKPDSDGETVLIPTYLQYDQPTSKTCFEPPETGVCSVEFASTSDHNDDSSLETAVTTSVNPFPLTGSERTIAERYLIQEKHNEHRKIPEATDMKKMVYSFELEKFAQEFLDNEYSCSILYNYGNNEYGENIFKKTYSPNEVPTINFEDIIKGWYNESFHYNSETNECASDKICSDYTQLVWNISDRVGCGVKQCDSESGSSTVVVICNYSPMGNLIPSGRTHQSKPFTFGPRCTDCKKYGPYSCIDNLCVSDTEAVLERWYAKFMVYKTKKEIAKTLELLANGKDGDDDRELTEWDMGGSEGAQTDSADNAGSKVQEQMNEETQDTTDNVNTGAKAQEDSQNIPPSLLTEEDAESENTLQDNSSVEVQVQEGESRTESASKEDNNGETTGVSPDQKAPTVKIDFDKFINLMSE